MQDQKIRIPFKFYLLFIFLIFSLPVTMVAQVSSVTFGKNRVQFKKLKWQYYQTSNFNCYFYDQGQQLAKYVMQIAEEELPSVEKFVEYSLQRRANILIYNTYDDMRQSNVGLGMDWMDAGGLTQLVNNKMVIYFNGNHADLRKQVRQGIAQILTQNLLFGDDLGEMAGNRALLDLPDWLVDGYVAYAAENWSPALDDELKSEILSLKYKNFYQFAFDKPLLAGHAFWYYIEEKYHRENTTYLLYLARVYKSLNKATQIVAKTGKFKDLLKDFMAYQEQKYQDDIRKRKNYPKGSEVTDVTVSKWVDYFHFNVNPNKRNSAFAVVQYKKGQYRLILNEDDGTQKTLLKIGSKTKVGGINPNYPLMAWDPKGTRLAVIYENEGRLKLFVYDDITKIRPVKLDLTNTFDQVQDMKYIYNSHTLLLSAVKNGQTDIYMYDMENEKVTQITNDVYDELDPSFVAFPGKTGILFSSNRPSAEAVGNDTSMMKNRFNIFMVTNFSAGKPELNQITQLTDLPFGDARFPTPYNDNHFTFLSDQSGINNRYAGFFTTKSAGVDTLVLINNEVFRNPTAEEVDSLLIVFHKTDVDSIAVVALSKDSVYSFPLTNYESSIRETREAGENHQVSEVTRQSDDKTLYKLKIDENTLHNRNVTDRPTSYMQNLMEKKQLSEGEIIAPPSTKKQQDVFQQQFQVTKSDTTKHVSPEPHQARVLANAKLFPYKPRKFATDYVVLGFNNDVLGTKFQPYQGGAGPVTLTSNNGLDGIIRMGVADLMEDIRIDGGFRLSTNLKDNDWLLQFTDLKGRIDWGLLYYKSVLEGSTQDGHPGKLYSNLYQGNISYPFDDVRSIRFNVGVRRDKTVLTSVDIPSLKSEIPAKMYGLFHAEYVYDNTLNPVMNIWNGFRYKIYTDINGQISGIDSIQKGRMTFNFGFDGRAYFPIYRNFIWAGRIAGDFSWGDQKFIYYLGGVDNWLMFGDNVKVVNGKQQYRFFNPANQPDPDVDYAFQTLAVNMRGFIQNAANGNNNIVINSEFRLPVFTTLMSRPINNAFLRNFQLTQFVDLGTAWNGNFHGIGRPSVTYTNPNDPTVQVELKAPGIGPFLGGYGFGARSTVLGYFLKADAGWPMNGFFRGKPIWYFSLGLDF